ncbi:hypothetical protein R50072_01300 [Simiduia litorea]
MLVNPMTDIRVSEVTANFQKFHDDVTTIFPCICSLSSDKIDEGVWCDGPLINNFKSKAPVIGFTYSKVEEALPVVGNLALKMGLSVLDWQAGKAYNP